MRGFKEMGGAWISASALIAILASSSCSHRGRVAVVTAPVSHELDQGAETEENRADDSGDRIPDASERVHWFDARRRTVSRLHEIHKLLGTPARQAASTAVNPSQWTFIGPQPIVFGATLLAGSVQNLAVDPHNPSTVYAGTFRHALWKTTDAGTTWQPLSDAGPLIDVTAIATDPSLANTVYVLNGGSIYKSADGGGTWTEAPVTPAASNCSAEALGVHPSVSGTWLISEYCGTPQSSSVIYKTTNGGSSWTGAATLSGKINLLGFNAGSPDSAYASGITPSLGVMFETSSNGGSTWTGAAGSGATALPQTLAGTSAYAAFAAAPTDPKTVYLRVEQPQNANLLLQLFKTTDGGKTWNLTNLPVETPGARVPALLAVDPKNSSLVFCGAQKVYLSTDGGSNWTDVRGDLSAGGLHGDNHAMIFTPDGNTLYTANDGGVWSSTTFRSPTIVWKNLNGTLGNAEFSGQLGMDPTNPNRSFGGLQDNFSVNYSGSPGWTVVYPNGDGRGSAVSPANVNTVYAMAGGNLLESSAGGAAGTFKGPIVSVSNAGFVLDLKNPQNLYAGGGGPGGLMQTMNGGKTWNPFGPSNAQNVSWVAVAPSDSNTVMLMDGLIPHITKNALAGSATTWTTGLSIGAAAGTGRPQQYVIDPADPTKVYAVAGSAAPNPAPLLVSSDGGMTWRANDLGPNVTDTPRRLVIDPDLANVLYLGTDTAVFRSSDGGGAWYPLGSGFPMSQVTDVELHRSARVLRVATIGRGAWDLAVPLTAPLVSSASLTASGSGYQLTVTGTNFTSSSQIWLNGKAVATTYASTKQLTASLLASSITASTVYNVSVNTPGTTGGLSDPVNASTGPTIYPGGVLNAASPVTVTNDLAGNPFDVDLSAGMFATIYGSGIAEATVLATSIPFPKTLGNVSVLVNGASAPLYYVSPGQIDFVIPFSTTAALATVQVISNGVPSNSVTLHGGVAPQLFTTNQQGFGQAAVLVAGTAIIAAPAGVFPGSRPAAKGEYLSIYATGLGPVTNAPKDGAPAAGLAPTIAQPVVRIGCPGNSGDLALCAVTPQFSGLAPGFVGLYQVNFQVPSAAASGPQVPLELIMPTGGRPSNIVTIAIQ